MRLQFTPKFGPFIQQNRQYSTGALASLFSAKTRIPSSSNISLFERIQVIRDPKSSVVPVIEQWVSEGRTIGKQQLQYLVRTMKGFKRFHHALEISQWMSDRRYLPVSSSDIALRLELIHRVHGIKQAEEYFNTVSNYSKTSSVYGALLSGYVRKKFVKKAEATMQKMRELDFATSSFPYNLLINLYTQTGDFDKVKILVQEMNQKGIPQDKYTICSQMAFYIAASDISGIERLLDLLEKDSRSFVQWQVYSMAASGYLKVGLVDKALSMLKKMEAMMPYQKTNLAVEFLICLYSSTGKKDELYRVWNKYKPTNEEINVPYACMITSLMKLDDLEGAEKVFEEWESQCTRYDFRVLNKLLVAYCRKGLFKKAESAVNKAIEGRTAYASTWNILAIGYMEHKQMTKAVEMLKRAISVGRQEWWPKSTLDACLDYLERQGDVSEMEDIIRLLKKLGPLNRDIYHRWLRTCAATGGSVSEVLDQMKMDGFSANEETQSILETRPSHQLAK